MKRSAKAPFVLVLLTAALGTETLAQDPPAADRMDLVILTNAPPMWSEANLREFLVDAIRDAPGCACDAEGVLVQRISPGTFAKLVQLINRGRRREMPPVGDEWVEQDPERSQYWHILIPKAQTLPDGIVVRYRDLYSGEDKEQRFDLAPVREEEARFRFYKPGLALFRAEDAWEMKEYAFSFGEEQQKVEFRPWPSGPRQFFIQVPDFTGGPEGRRRLFAAMESGQVGEILVNESQDKPCTFAHVNLATPPPNGDDLFWYGSSFVVVFGALPDTPFHAETGRGAARVWMLFPLTEEEKDKIVEFLKERRPTRGELSDMIRESTALYDVLLASEVDERVTSEASLPANYPKPSVVLEPDTVPVWYEIPAVLDEQGNLKHYARTFQLQKVEEWKRAATGQGRVWRLYAYEFQFPGEEGQMVNRIKLVTKDNQTGLWIVEPIEDWATEVEKAAKSADE
jgi:hypothetical protein